MRLAAFNNSPIETIFFDLDGTIIDSSSGVFASLSRALLELGYAEELAQFPDLSWVIGPPMSDSVSRIISVNSAGKNMDTQSIEVLKLFRHYYGTRGYKDMKPYKGIEALLGDLSLQVRIDLVTSKPETYARKILVELGVAPYFSDIIGAHEDERPHSKGDMIAEFLARHSIDHRKAIMIGDRKFDFDAASSNNLAGSIAVLYGFGSAEEAQRHGAKLLCSSVEELRKILLA